jgi:hypothetical protein
MRASSVSVRNDATGAAARSVGGGATGAGSGAWLAFSAAAAFSFAAALAAARAAWIDSLGDLAIEQPPVGSSWVGAVWHVGDEQIRAR